MLFGLLENALKAFILKVLEDNEMALIKIDELAEVTNIPPDANLHLKLNGGDDRRITGSSLKDDILRNEENVEFGSVEATNRVTTEKLTYKLREVPTFAGLNKTGADIIAFLTSQGAVENITYAWNCYYVRGGGQFRSTHFLLTSGGSGIITTGVVADPGVAWSYYSTVVTPGAAIPHISFSL